MIPYPYEPIDFPPERRKKFYSKWWKDEIPLVGDLISNEIPVRISYPVEKVGICELV